MERGVSLGDLRVEAFEADVGVTALLGVDRSGKRVGVRELQVCSDADCGGAAGKCEIDVDRLDAERANIASTVSAPAGPALRSGPISTSV